MRLMTSVVWLALCVAVLGLTACSDGGGGSDAGLDGSTDTDGGVDGGDDTSCPVHVIGTDGSDAASGSSWEEGLATVERGLDLAEPLGCDVWVKAGTYLPTEDGDGSSTPVDPRTVTFRLRAGVALYGGFAGDEATIEERPIAAYETILSGDLGAVDNNSDNSYYVVEGANDATIDGFTVTGGNAGGESPNDRGGGMLNVNASPTVTNCTFSDNVADYGGGMYNLSSSPTVTNCTFSDNFATGGGGGMYNNDSSPTVTNCTFSGNSASKGGGMENVQNSSPIVTNCTFSGNTAGNGGGGGMYNNDSSPTVTNCTFTDNTAAGEGGGIYNWSSLPTVTNCTFSDNSAYTGGGMYNNVSSPTVTNCTFTGNSAAYNGGGMAMMGPSSTVTGCTFTGNSAAYGGGGMYIEICEPPYWPLITNCILWGDTGDEGNSEILWGCDSSATVSYSNVQGGCTVAAGCTTDETGNIDADPLFVDAEGGDLRLQSTSPCIDTGSNDAVPDDVTTDLDGNPRIVDGNGDTTATVDMGAYEYQP